MKHILIYLLLILHLTSCGVPEEKYNSLSFENRELRDSIKVLTDELNDLKFGATTILKRAKIKIDNNEYLEAKTLLENILNKYASSKETSKARAILKEIIPKIEEQKFLLAEKEENKLLLEEYISEYPNGKFVNDANKLLIKFEVRETFANASYKSLPNFSKEYDFSSEETLLSSTINVENNTESSITLLFSGPEQAKIELPSKGSRNVQLSNGNYKIVAIVDGNEKYAREDYFDGKYSVIYEDRRTQPNYSTNSNSFNSYPSNNYNRYKSNSYNSNSRRYNNNSNTNNSRRVGAICCDGTRSDATGRGACSHHGGVCQWLYE
ncbi:MAG: hypothetical protein U0Y10_12465 [Spirosomataceae bacterium]